MQIKTKSLPSHILHIVQEKGTEPPFSCNLNHSSTIGTYVCRQCGLALFRSHAKFNSGCGWPSFEEEIQNHVTTQIDRDGRRSEILCARCQAHLGHVFAGEGFTVKNIRHCVNSLSIEYVDDDKVTDTKEAIFAAGCFWGVEYYFKKLNGVLKTEVGYSGGNTTEPTYKDICTKRTGHLEVLRVLYDPNKLSYENLVKYFFEIHDPTQTNGQGPDLGEQYLSAIFYFTEEEKQEANGVIEILEKKGCKVATKLVPAAPFWPAEDYHQDYYAKTGKEPYCHVYQKKFS